MGIGQLIGIIAIVGFFVVFILVAQSGKKADQNKIDEQAQRLQEYAFCLGQAQAINGNLYLKKNDAGIFELTKTIWEDGSDTIYDPVAEHLEKDL
jgi:gas vesicle protein